MSCGISRSRVKTKKIMKIPKKDTCWEMLKGRVIKRQVDWKLKMCLLHCVLVYMVC